MRKHLQQKKLLFYDDLTAAVAALSETGFEAPDPKAYGTFIDSIPNAVSGLLEKPIVLNGFRV
mgnify:CR=1 FL=1